MGRSLYRLIARRPGAALAAFALLVAASVLATGRLRFERDIFDALPAEGPVAVLVHAARTSGGPDRLYLLFRDERDPDGLVARARGVVDRLRALRIEGRPAFRSVTLEKAEAAGAGDLPAILETYLRRPRLFLTGRDAEALRARLASPAALDRELHRSLAFLAAPGADAAAAIAARDPLNLRALLMDKLRGLQAGLAFAPGPLLRSTDKTALLVACVPALAPERRAAARRLLRMTRTAAAGLGPAFRGITGGFAVAVEEEALLRHDLLACLLGSGIGISLLFLLAYRSPAVLAFVLLPLGVGLQLALGALALVAGRVHLMAAAFSAVVLGLGIDFAIHVYDRYLVERQRGRATAAAVEAAVLRTGPPVAVGGLTTAAAFAVLFCSGIPVLHQVAWLVDLGLLFCLAAILWALPAWLLWRARSGERPAGHLGRLGMDRLGRLVADRPRAAAAASALVLAAAIPGLFRVGIEHDPRSLHPADLPSIRVQEEIRAAFGAGAGAFVTWTARDPARFWEIGRTVDGVLEDLQAEGRIRSWASLTRITRGRPPRLPPALAANARAALARAGFRPGDFPLTEAFLEALARPDDTETLLGPGDLEKLPRPFHAFFRRTPGGLQGIARVALRTPSGLGDLSRRLADRAPGAEAFDPDTALRGLLGSVRGEVRDSVLLAAALILGLLFAFFRRPGPVAMAAVPVTLASVVTLGLMGLAGIPFNLFNFMVVPLVLGIGLDDGIHVLRRYAEEGDVAATLATTGRSVLLTTLTTCLGFGSLALASHPLLRGMGLVTIAGILAAWFFSAVTLPALLRLREAAGARGRGPR
ncbi:MMPL family transporter [Dissulfurirhabdus thermomarina]|uniref:MMPL family transporter n=1 Tax=Dissulfurirhabdus thermomarina TaxID=1765737 RepID=A0A6N9TJY8_DISTH|nr:MMPL family transporter [Dissulfurirhabdus thermomarina]NDY41398.1 MMPL family transporter [Dissulfurirhabdus thermomarina]NMX23586.1 MMPL family transporter [Dissulfurirhabdus thermomarina]